MRSWSKIKWWLRMSRKAKSMRYAVPLTSYMGNFMGNFYTLSTTQSCGGSMLKPSAVGGSRGKRTLPHWVGLSKSSMRCVGVTRGWLFLVNPEDEDCSMYLSKHPFLLNNQKKFKLPPIATHELVYGVKHSPEDNAWKVSIDAGEDHPPLLMSFRELSSYINSFALSSAELEGNKGCVLVADFFSSPQFRRYGKLVFCRPGRDQRWFTLDDHSLSSRVFLDIIFSEKDGLFYITSSSSDSSVLIQGWDLHSNFPRPILRSQGLVTDTKLYHLSTAMDDPEWILSALCLKTCYLVVDEYGDGDVFLAFKHLQRLDDPEFKLKTVRFDVFRLLKRKNRGPGSKAIELEFVDSLGDKALFLGLNESICLSTANHQEFQPNSIYFASGDHKLTSWRANMSDDSGIYNLAHRTITPGDFPFEDIKKIKPALFWHLPEPSVKSEITAVVPA